MTGGVNGRSSEQADRQNRRNGTTATVDTIFKSAKSHADITSYWLTDILEQPSKFF